MHGVALGLGLKKILDYVFVNIQSGLQVLNLLLKHLPVLNQVLFFKTILFIVIWVYLWICRDLVEVDFRMVDGIALVFRIIEAGVNLLDSIGVSLDRTH